MRRIWIGRSLLLACLSTFAFLVVSCRAEVEGSPTSVPTIEDQPFVAAEVSMTTLLRNLYTFEGEYVSVSGQFKPLPLMACKADAHWSPATWAIAEGDVEIPAAGFDEELRQLEATGHPLVVEGRWQRWEGPVGCGRRAPKEEVWHLQVSRIVSPNPLLPASVGVGEEAASPTQTSAPSATATATNDLGLISPTPLSGDPSVTPIPTQSATVGATESATQIATTPPTPTPSAIASVTTSPTSGPTDSPLPSETPSATATRLEGSETPEATTTPSPTPSATPTLAPGVGTLEAELIVRSDLGIGEVGYWEFEGIESDVISVSAGPAAALDVAIELVDPNGTTIVVTNDESEGQGETIFQATLESSGVFRVEVLAVGSSSGTYSVVLTNTESEAFLIFKKNLTYGSVGTGDAPADADHLWNFEALAGDEVTIRAEPVDNHDLVLFLIAPDSTELLFMDDAGPGEGEEIVAYVLTESGTYSIRVGELELQPISYSVTLDGS